MRIVFMGTPEFAVPSLQRLIEDGHEVAAVYTQPDKPKGRGYQLAAPPVKELALQHGIPVYQPTKMKDGSVAAQLREIAPDLIAVVAYGRILPKEILEIPPYGCVNVHGSILPKYRGAGPIQWSVIHGDPETGVTTMLMAEGLDTGDMLLTLKTPIGEEEDSHLGDFIQDDNVLVPQDAAAFTLLHEQLMEVLLTLTEREQKVLRLRFGLDDGRPRTLEEVGKQFNVTRERIRQIEAKALRKLRHPSRSKKLKDYLDE